MHNKNISSWVIAAAVAMLVLGFVIVHPLNPEPKTTSPSSIDTVPSQLLTAEQSPAAISQTPQPTATEVAVYVCGSVRKPGVYRFASGLRVSDAIARAGGELADADLEQLNLAEPLADAMKIDVPKKGQVLAFSFPANAAAAPSSRSGYHRSRGGSRSSHKLQPGQTLDVNTASESELTALPGVGPGLARRIMEYRAANGPFQTVDDLQNVSGIGPSKFERMAPFIRL